MECYVCQGAVSVPRDAEPGIERDNITNELLFVYDVLCPHAGTIDYHPLTTAPRGYPRTEKGMLARLTPDRLCMPSPGALEDIIQNLCADDPELAERYGRSAPDEELESLYEEPFERPQRQRSILASFAAVVIALGIAIQPFPYLPTQYPDEYFERQQ